MELRKAKITVRWFTLDKASGEKKRLVWIEPFQQYAELPEGVAAVWRGKSLTAKLFPITQEPTGGPCVMIGPEDPAPYGPECPDCKSIGVNQGAPCWCVAGSVAKTANSSWDEIAPEPDK